MPPLEDEFGDIIQKARTGLGLTLKQVADRAHMSPSLLEDMESYKYIPSKEDIDSIACQLRLDAEKLYVSAMDQWHPADLPSDRLSDISLICGSIGSYSVNGYILIDRQTGEAAAFDTANDSRNVLKIVHDRGLNLRYIFLTHCHADHTGGLTEIFMAAKAGIGIPEGESFAGSGEEMNKEVFTVKDGSEFRVGSHNIKAVATPGHTPGSTCYITQDYCFSGDTLFAGSLGRAYSQDGYKTMLNSVSKSILALDKGVHIFPGHGPVTTVGEEVAHNPFF